MCYIMTTSNKKTKEALTMIIHQLLTTVSSNSVTENKQANKPLHFHYT